MINPEYKSKAAEKLKEEKINNRKGLLKAKNFPESIAKWARINKVYVTIQFENPSELKKFFDLKDIIKTELEYCKLVDENNKVILSNIDDVRDELLVLINKEKLHNKRELLKLKCFPTELVLWARVNPKYVTLSFESYKELEKLLILSEYIESSLPLCLERRILYEKNRENAEKNPKAN